MEQKLGGGGKEGGSIQTKNTSMEGGYGFFLEPHNIATANKFDLPELAVYHCPYFDNSCSKQGK